MLSNLELYLSVLIVSSAVYWLIPATGASARTNFLIGVSALLLLVMAPAGFVSVSYFCLLAIASNRLLKRRWLMVWLGLSLLPMVLTRVVGDLGPIYTFGIAFTTVKTIGVLLENASRPGRFSNQQIALFLYFFPLITIGPVERPETFASSDNGKSLQVAPITIGLLRVVGGIFVVHFICDGLIQQQLAASRFAPITSAEATTASTAWIFVALKFLFTYLNFVGFSEIAIGSSAAFGYRVLENFNRPLVATNIQEFWRRYHISMGNWITRYIFFPIVGLINRKWATYCATFCAFVIFGAWHAFTLNYLFWGVMHGIALVCYQFYSKRIHKNVRLSPPISLGVRGISTFATIAYVAYLQTFANLDNVDQGIALSFSLFGIP